MQAPQHMINLSEDTIVPNETRNLSQWPFFKRKDGNLADAHELIKAFYSPAS